MTMPPRLRRLALVVHITSTAGWMGAVAGFLALAIAGLTSQEAGMLRAAYPAMELITSFVIVPLSLAALLSGLVSALGSAWGLFRHYWVLIKLLITLLATLVLLLQLGPIRYLAGAAATGLSGSDFRQARISLVVHAAGGLLVLLVPMVLSVYKPRGLTPYGQRKLAEVRNTARRGRSQPQPDGSADS